MAEYIEREALNKWLHETMSVQTTTVGMAYVRDFWNKVMSVPAADVAPVAHGWWESIDDNSWRCSVCRKENCYAYDETSERFTDLYCPNCGAKMDGKSCVPREDGE